MQDCFNVYLNVDILNNGSIIVVVSGGFLTADNHSGPEPCDKGRIV